jgi:hypothetical protein
LTRDFIEFTAVTFRLRYVLSKQRGDDEQKNYQASLGHMQITYIYLTGLSEIESIITAIIIGLFYQPWMINGDDCGAIS